MCFRSDGARHRPPTCRPDVAPPPPPLACFCRLHVLLLLPLHFVGSDCTLPANVGSDCMLPANTQAADNTQCLALSSIGVWAQRVMPVASQQEPIRCQCAPPTIADACAGRHAWQLYLQGSFPKPEWGRRTLLHSMHPQPGRLPPACVLLADLDSSCSWGSAAAGATMAAAGLALLGRKRGQAGVHEPSVHAAGRSWCLSPFNPSAISASFGTVSSSAIWRLSRSYSLFL